MFQDKSRPGADEPLIVPHKLPGSLPPQSLVGASCPQPFSKLDLQSLGLVELPLEDGMLFDDPGQILDYRRTRSISPIVKICDIPLAHLRNDPQALRLIACAIHRLEEKLAVPYNDRCEVIDAFRDAKAVDQLVPGFWYVDSPGQLERRFSDPGAELFIIKDVENRVRGAIMLDTCPLDLFKDDLELIRAFRRSGTFKENPEARCSVLYAAGIDPLIELPLELGGLGLSRFELYKLMHALSIRKAAESGSGLDRLVSSVRTFPCANAAIAAHAKLGWEKTDCPPEKKPHYFPTLGSTAQVIHSVLHLETRSERQAQVLAEAQEWVLANPGVHLQDFNPTRLCLVDSGPRR